MARAWTPNADERALAVVMAGEYTTMGLVEHGKRLGFDGHSAYRLAESLQQKLRRRGWATFEKRGNKVLWRLNSDGREHMGLPE